MVHITVSIIPSFGIDPTHKMLSRFKFLGRQQSQTAVTVAFKIGPINATDKIGIGRPQNLLHVMKHSKSVSRAEEIISKNLKYLLHNDYGYKWSI